MSRRRKKAGGAATARARRLRRPFHRHRRATPGTAPGLLHVDPGAHPTTVRVIVYGPTVCEEHDLEEVERLPDLLRRGAVTWVDVAGLADAAVLSELGRLFDLHPLALEDVVHLGQRAKVEPYGDHAFLIVHMPVAGSQAGTEQVSLFVREGLVLTFQERPGDCFEPVRERLRHGRGRMRGRGADYLAYALVDAVVDAYFPEIEALGERLERLEERILAEPDDETMTEVHHVRRELIALRKAVAPHREALAALLRESVPPFTEPTLVFLRDVYDHVLRVQELIEGYRELGASLMDLYLTGLSNRTNEVMKVLTMIATIFIPLSFLAGLYGMNFDTSLPGNLPELAQPYGYVVLLCVMAAVAIVLLVYFRRKRWL